MPNESDRTVARSAKKAELRTVLTSDPDSPFSEEDITAVTLFVAKRPRMLLDGREPLEILSDVLCEFARGFRRVPDGYSPRSALFFAVRHELHRASAKSNRWTSIDWLSKSSAAPSFVGEADARDFLNRVFSELQRKAKSEKERALIRSIFTQLEFKASKLIEYDALDNSQRDAFRRLVLRLREDAVQIAMDLTE